MKNILIGLLLITTTIFASELNYNNSLRIEAKAGPYYDFGVCGKQYDITEPDMYEIIIKGVQEFQSKENLEKLKEQVKEIVKKKATFKTDKQYCSRTYEYPWHDDIYTYKEDIKNPFGRIIKHKGEKSLVPAIQGERALCFVDGKNWKSLINQVKFMQKETNGKCIYIVQNRDVRDLWKKFNGYDFYPGSENILERFKVECLPAIIKMKGSQNKEIFYSIEQFKN